MLIKIKKSLLLIILIAVISVGYWSVTALAEDNSVLPPSTVTVDRALFTDGRGVEVSWLESDDGSSPIENYIVERSRDNSGFKVIGQTEKTARSYLDNEGQIGDQYRVIAEDSQKPASHSPDSEIALAVNDSPGTDHEELGGIQPALKTAHSMPNLNTSTQEAVEKHTSDILNSLDKALSGNKQDRPDYLINELQLLNRRGLALLPSLTPQRQTAMARDCQLQSDGLEANYHILPESAQFDGLLAQAACEAIQDIAP